MLTANDIPKENLFMLGLTVNKDFLIVRTRSPFTFSKAEALNLIGYMIAHAQFDPADIDAAVRELEHDPFLTVAGNDRFMITGPNGPLFMFSQAAGLSLIGALVRKGGIHPSEIDAAVIAIEEQGRGQTMQDALRTMQVAMRNPS